MYDFIDTHKAEILHNCLVKLRETRQGETDEELVGDLAHFIDGFVGVLRRDAGASDAETLEESAVRKAVQATEAAGRGLARKSQGRDITRVIHDYGVLCDKLNELAAREGRVFSSRDHQLMNIFLDEAMARGIEAYAAATATDEREGQAAALGSLAHEIRNAASSASLAFALIRKGQVGSGGKTADVLERGLTRIEALVQDALIQAKLRGKVPVRAERLRLADVLGQCVEGAYPRRGVEVRVQVGHELHVHAEAGLLVSAVSNLVQNAIKFTRDGEHVTLRARQTDDTTIIEVEDRCGGLPRGKAEALFEPFVQGRLDPRGVGLGLHVVRNAIEAHGGSVSVQDLPGVGCVFTIRLPGETREPAGRLGTAAA
jgi:signal transduction histidine kinase